MPHVNTKEEAERVVRGAKYALQGMRGMAGPRQGYGVTDYYSKANDEILVAVLIEDVVAIKNLAEILTVDNIDCFIVAPSDLGQAMGPHYLGQPGHPDVQAVVEKAMQETVAAGRATGTVANDTTVERYLDLGARFFLTNTQGYVANGLRGFQERVVTRVR